MVIEELKKPLAKKKDVHVVPESLEGRVTKEAIQNKFWKRYTILRTQRRK